MLRVHASRGADACCRGRRRFAKGVLVSYILFVALYSYVGLRAFKS